MMHTLHTSRFYRPFFNWQTPLLGGFFLIAMALVIVFFPEILIAFIAAMLLFMGVGLIAFSLLLRKTNAVAKSQYYPMM